MLKRIVNLFIALFAISIIAMETCIYWHTKFHLWHPDSSIQRLIYYYSFFTVLSNLMLALSCFCLAINPNCNQYSFKVLRLNSLIGVTITAVVYNLAARDIHVPPNMLLKIANESLHVVIPALGLLSWFIWGPFRRIDLKVFMGSLLSMIGYGIYIFIRGHYTNQYPYRFINVVQIGYPQALLGVSQVFLLFFLLAFLYWMIECLRSRK
ncbi:Pr6Pr family membrane protein [Gilliamella sp. App4-10]|uniref:Pr6Pr family membrane protein n=1 Tax=Gilliamella sp. App4-10 TaxID=3120231 RepID=UPI00080E2A11|nr:Pr6Pr family membrane protein [Gilliamella apicola]OCG19803.1 hypothetical protein A9G23_08610 [Gilliamella apicola]